MSGRVGLPIALLSGLLLVAATAESRSRLAPADEYFGRFRMSPLEITNRINDAERRGASYRGLVNTQDAIEDWTAKYPDDPWIASREYRMSRLFAHLRSADGNAEAGHCRAFLREHFPGTSYSVAAERDDRAGAKHVA
ncbi:MAG TPA: hypothetical protein VFF63_01965, partial [Candidatus Babeliales bacterium]|nr:hypothetical protein [Candidatus Babeliales bacterium]